MDLIAKLAAVKVSAGMRMGRTPNFGGSHGATAPSASLNMSSGPRAGVQTLAQPAAGYSPGGGIHMSLPTSNAAPTGGGPSLLSKATNFAQNNAGTLAAGAGALASGIGALAGRARPGGGGMLSTLGNAASNAWNRGARVAGNRGLGAGVQAGFNRFQRMGGVQSGLQTLGAGALGAGALYGAGRALGAGQDKQSMVGPLLAGTYGAIHGEQHDEPIQGAVRGLGGYLAGNLAGGVAGAALPMGLLVALAHVMKKHRGALLTAAPLAGAVGALAGGTGGGIIGARMATQKYRDHAAE
jgi:X-X-X-Leu-X-X-Gly heptad repeat protein